MSQSGGSALPIVSTTCGHLLHQRGAAGDQWRLLRGGSENVVCPNNIQQLHTTICSIMPRCIKQNENIWWFADFQFWVPRPIETEPLDCHWNDLHFDTNALVGTSSRATYPRMKELVRWCQVWIICPFMDMEEQVHEHCTSSGWLITTL